MPLREAHSERAFRAISAWPILIALLVVLPVSVILTAVTKLPVILLFVFLPAFVMLFGFFIVSPNDSRVLVLFGRYRGTVRTDGFYWTNPFTAKKKVSLKAHNLNGERLKVNDLLGNPIEIAVVVVWQVEDTARALFDVEDHTQFVSVQSEAAVRQLASRHPYDDGQADGVETTLRGSSELVADELEVMLQERLDRAGVRVLEARLSHLAYAQEIASAMLQRQQASAIISARSRIVEGAVGMVEMAIAQLEKGGAVELDSERRAALVGNLLVVLCAHESPTPVLNTGTLYH
ncbi:MAG: SPFH domain-containing protein [Planctomycetaceae bacterium]|nr:SPFH domain-containing protein [Planctomycetaceae bacterium]